jgi:TPR repeat protein
MYNTRIRSLFFVLFLLVTCLPHTGHAGLAEGLNAYKMGDYKTALKEFKKDGSPKALFYQAFIYYNGKGVKQDKEKGLKLLSTAAEKGDANAQLSMGLFYDKGGDLPRDLTLAASWYKKSAEQGNAQAQFNYAMLLTSGEGVTKNREEAIHWLKKAAAQHHENAIKLLKVMQPEPKDKEKKP